MQFIKFEKVKDGRYLKNYEITYQNKAGREKKYEIVSRKEIHSIEDLGKTVNGVSMAVIKDEKLLLLKEFRMGINCCIYNLVAGMKEDHETIEACIERELFEETGLKLKKINKILPPSFAAVAISDIMTQVAFIEAEGEFEDHTSENEMIEAALYSREEIKQMLETEKFSSRAQVIAYFFAYHSDVLK
ncbi:MAG: NUDIX hydrolase [Lachnospiraceae bacterium]|nr:NUDIX hydrolase [Lachnospiraceae bacterium]MDD3659345.1 NUDIX hydrolase [Lachnospiraceae bacterium]